MTNYTAALQNSNQAKKIKKTELKWSSASSPSQVAFTFPTLIIFIYLDIINYLIYLHNFMCLTSIRLYMYINIIYTQYTNDISSSLHRWDNPCDSFGHRGQEATATNLMEGGIHLTQFGSGFESSIIRQSWSIIVKSFLSSHIGEKFKVHQR